MQVNWYAAANLARTAGSFLRSKKREGGIGCANISVLLAVMALTLAGCQTAREDRILGGSLIGGGTGALIGGLAGGTAGAAVRCYYHTRSGHRRYVRCP